MASRAATDEGVEEESCGLLRPSFRAPSLDMDSRLFLRSPFLVFVGITTGLVVDWGVSIFGGIADLAALSFLKTRSAAGTGFFFSSLCIVDVLEGGVVWRYALGTIMMEDTERCFAYDQR